MNDEERPTLAMLTEEEHALVEKLGECAGDFRRILGLRSNAPVWLDDQREFVAHIHDLQNAVLANAAARAYPYRYRLAGRITRQRV